MSNKTSLVKYPFSKDFSLKAFLFLFFSFSLLITQKSYAQCSNNNFDLSTINIAGLTEVTSGPPIWFTTSAAVYAIGSPGASYIDVPGFPITDHTTGSETTGEIFAINAIGSGATDGQLLEVINFTQTVQPNSSYTLSLAYMNWNGETQINVNGINVLTETNSASNFGIWTDWSYTGNSGANTTITVSINVRRGNSGISGENYMFDDIVLSYNGFNNADNDNDTIGNTCDLDNDNDGILDTQEGLCTALSGFDWDNQTVSTTVPSTTTSTINGNLVTVNFSGNGWGAANPNITQTGGNARNLLDDDDLNGSGSGDDAFLRTRGDNGDVYNTTTENNRIDTDVVFTTPVDVLKFSFADVDFSDFVSIYAVDVNGNTIFPNYTSPSGVTTQWVVYEPIDANNPVLNRRTVVGSGQASSTSASTVYVDFDGNFQIKEVFIRTGYLDSDGFYDTPDTNNNASGGGNQSNSLIFAGDYLFCSSLDTDNDGTPNFLDTDSDNDGCPDALEGGNNILANAVDANGRLTGTANTSTNGVPNNVSATTGQPVGTSANSTAFDSFGQCDQDNDGVVDADDLCNGFDDNADNDNDNVPDGCDVDDDNDGILDTDEGLLSTELNSLNGVNDANGITVNLSNTSNCPTGQTSTGSSIVSFDIGWNNGVGGGFVNTGNPATSNTEAILTLSVNGVNYLTIETPSDGTSNTDNATEFGGDAIITPLNGALFTNTPIAPLVASSQGANYINHSPYNNWNYAAIKVTLPLNVMGNVNIGIDLNSDDYSILNAQVESSCSLDSDNDGIPDYFDTDSDDDGCPDAVEANATILTTQLQELAGGSNGVDSSLLNLGTTVNTTSTSPNYGVPTQNALGVDITGSMPQQTTAAVIDDTDATSCLLADLSITKTASSNTPLLGYEMSFTIEVSNAGPDNATGVNVTDQLPAGYNFLSATTTQGTYNETTGIWDVGTVNNGANATLTIAAAPFANNPLFLENIAEISASDTNDPDSIPGTGNTNGITADDGLDGDANVQEDDEALVTPTPILGTGGTAPDLTCIGNPDVLNWDTITLGTSEVTNEELLTQTLQSTNGTTVVFNIPQTNNTPNILDYSINNMLTGGISPAEDSFRFFIDFTDVNETITNTIDLGTPGIGVSDLSFRIFDIDSRADRGYADNVTITGSFNGVNVPVVLVSEGSLVSVNGNTATAAFSTGANDNTSSGNLFVAFDGVIDQVQIISTTGDISPITTNPIASSFSIHDINFCSLDADLRLTKTVNTAIVKIGESITYTLTVFNNGPIDATGVQVTDMLPSGLTFTKASSTNYTSSTGVWNINNLASGTSTSLQITATVNGAGEIVNKAQITQVNQNDPDSAPNIGN